MCPNLLNAKKSEEPRDLYTAEWARLRGRLDDLLKQLRRHYLFVPTSCRAPYVLDALFDAFADLTSQTARLYEEISCLDKDDGIDASGCDFKNHLPVLLAAATIHNRTLQWRRRFS